MPPVIDTLLPFEWLFAQSALELRSVVHTTAGFTAIHPTEMMDPSPYILPGSIVLTTGITWTGSPTTIEDYVHRLHNAGTIGIGFGTEVAVDKVPATLISSCRALGLGLFEVPLHVPFVSIQSTAFDERERRRNRSRTRLNKLHSTLAAEAASSGLPGLVAEASSHLNCSIAVADPSGDIVAMEDPHGLHQTLADALLPNTSFAKVSLHLATITTRTAVGNVVAAAAPSSFSTFDRAVLTYAAELCDVLSYKTDSTDGNLAVANVIAPDLALPLALRELESFLNSAHVRVCGIEATSPVALEESLAKMPYPTLRASDTEALVLTPPDAEVVPQRQVRAAISRSCPLSDITPSLAEFILDVARSARAGSVISPQETADSWVTGTSFRDLLTSHVNAQVTQLDEAGLATHLVSFLRHDGNIAAAADELNIHRHTMRSRLTAINTVLGSDIRDPIVKSQWTVAMTALGRL
ncbi:PucR family transcriptional regulator [Corynebacterium cystitidis]|nr:PucR family transcriptional regulator [Corynebacterium cystitidis]